VTCVRLDCCSPRLPRSFSPVHCVQQFLVCIWVAIFTFVCVWHVVREGANSHAHIVLPVLTFITLDPSFVIVIGFFSHTTDTSDLPWRLTCWFCLPSVLFWTSHNMRAQLSGEKNDLGVSGCWQYWHACCVIRDPKWLGDTEWRRSVYYLIL